MTDGQADNQAVCLASEFDIESVVLYGERRSKLTSRYGSRAKEHDVTNAKILNVEVYCANGHISPDYPHHGHTNFFMAVSETGKTYYLQRTSPFNAEEYIWALITEEIFNEHET